MRIECPSRLVLEGRPFGGKELVLLGDQKGSSRSAAAVGAILGAVAGCWVETVDAGPYPGLTEGPGRPGNLSRLMWGDILKALAEIRRATFPDKRSTIGMQLEDGSPDERPMGDVLDFDVNCERCGALIPWCVDLRVICEERVRPIDPEVARLISLSQAIPFTTPSGVKVEWNPSTPAMDDALRTFLKKQPGRNKETPVDFVAKHLAAVHVKGVDTNLRSLHRWCLEKCPPNDIDAIVRDINDRQPSFDNEEYIRCEECGAQQVIVLPFVGPSFAQPRSSFQARQTLERAAATKRDREREKDLETPSTAGGDTP